VVARHQSSMLRLERPAGADDLVLEGSLAAAGKARDVALRRLGPRLQRLAALIALDQRAREHKDQEKDRDVNDQRHGAMASGACPVKKGAIPEPAGPPPTRLWTRGLPAFRTWGTVAM